MNRKPEQIIEVDGHKTELIHHLAKAATKILDGDILIELPKDVEDDKANEYRKDGDPICYIELTGGQEWIAKVCVYLLKMEGLCTRDNMEHIVYRFDEYPDHFGNESLDFDLMRYPLKAVEDSPNDFRRTVNRCKVYVDETLGMPIKIKKEKLIKLYAAYDIALLAIKETPEDDD